MSPGVKVMITFSHRLGEASFIERAARGRAGNEDGVWLLRILGRGRD